MLPGGSRPTTQEVIDYDTDTCDRNEVEQVPQPDGDAIAYANAYWFGRTNRLAIGLADITANIDARTLAQAAGWRIDVANNTFHNEILSKSSEVETWADLVKEQGLIPAA